MSSEFKVWNFNHRTAGKSQGGLFCLELRRVLRHLSQEKVLLANVFFFPPLLIFFVKGFMEVLIGCISSHIYIVL